MRELGFVRPGINVTARGGHGLPRPVVDPLRASDFTFTREWMRRQAARIGDPRREEARVGRMLNLPPSYLLIHRVTLGSIGVLVPAGRHRALPRPRRALAARVRRRERAE